MKNKIKAALEQKWGATLGLKDDEAFEGVAAVGETLITEEAKIPEFVEKAGTMLKTYQSYADKARTANRRVGELEAEKKVQNTEQPKEEADNTPKEDIAKIIADTVAASTAAADKRYEELLNEFRTYKGQQDAKEARAAAQATFQSNDYVKKYTEQAETAWERAIEIYELGGSKMTAQELSDKAMGYFNKSVSKKGIDTSKPIDGDGANGENKLDTSKFVSSLQELGLIAKSETK
jgi:hypothetical protein